MDTLTEFNHSTTILIDVVCIFFFFGKMIYIEIQNSIIFCLFQNKELRIFAVYFRVGFYGDILKEENGKSYIYRCDAKENLMTIQQRIKGNITKTYGISEDQIEVVGNQQVDEAMLKQWKVCLQIAMVVPHRPDVLPTGNPPTLFNKHFGVSKLKL
jgi:hypothetical protein